MKDKKFSKKADDEKDNDKLITITKFVENGSDINALVRDRNVIMKIL